MKTFSIHNITNSLFSSAKWMSLVILFSPNLSYSQENILAVLSGDDKIYHAFYTRLSDRIYKNIAITSINVSDLNTVNLENHRLIITVGHQAAAEIYKKKQNLNIIYSLIPDNSAPGDNINCAHQSCYKVYINQPVSRYVSLFKTIFPDDYTLVFATTTTATKRSLQLQSAADIFHLNYKEIIIDQKDEIARTLISNLNDKDILLALSDPEIYNANNAKSILLSTYHKNVPIIAYSKSFAKAGALISLYSSIEDIADKTASIANKISSNEKMDKKEFYPDNFSIEINSAVAKSLNIDIDSIKNIKRKIQ